MDFPIEWDYAPSEWERFEKTERGQKHREHVMLFLTIMFAGAALIVWLRDSDWMTATLVAGIFGGLVWAGKYWLLQKQFSSFNGTYRVILTKDALFYGDYKIEHTSSRRRVNNARIRSVKNSSSQHPTHIFELTIGWNTRGGQTSDEFRFPIPCDKQKEAERLRDYFTLNRAYRGKSA